MVGSMPRQISCLALAEVRVEADLRRQMFWPNKPGANTKTVMFKVKFCMKSIRQRPHELKAKSPIDRRIEILRKTDAIVSHFHHE